MAKVDRVVDGDTVFTKDGTKIRLHGVDTPERDRLIRITGALGGVVDSPSRQARFFRLIKGEEG